MSSNEQSPPRRTIRSFVRREGRMSDLQKNAIAELGPHYGLEFSSETLDIAQTFQRQAPTFLEIGFGMGGSLVAMAEAYPENNYIGIEVHRPGVGRLLANVHEKRLTNLKIFCHDAVEILKQTIADDCLDGVFLFFPDPWPKAKHHKRRIVQPAFAALAAKKLKPGGFFHMATDWENYAEHMLDVMNNAPMFVNQSLAGGAVEKPSYRPLTKFEQRGQRLGHGIWDLVFVKHQFP
jgi:tRNA (guanine-N7-)-methyltransferase